VFHTTYLLYILVRSLIVLNLYFNEQIFGQHPLTELIAKNLQQPSQLYQLPYLVTNTSKLYDILKVLALNRNRQRAYIDAVMQLDWSPVFQEAQLVSWVVPMRTVMLVYLFIDLFLCQTPTRLTQ
jgi:hypothetical protein